MRHLFNSCQVVGFYWSRYAQVRNVVYLLAHHLRKDNHIAPVLYVYRRYLVVVCRYFCIAFETALCGFADVCASIDDEILHYFDRNFCL